MENNRITIFNCLKIFILLKSTALIFIFSIISEKLNLNTLDFFSSDIGEIISVICALIYLYKKFDITLTSLLNVKKTTLKTAILILLMFFSSYVIINLIDTNITNILSITPSPQHNHDNRLNRLSVLEGLFFLISLTITGPIMEEIFFRGIFLLKLKDNFNRIATLILSTFIFAFFHSPGYQQINAFITGLLFGIVTLKTNGIFYSIIGHIIFNSFTTILGIVSYYNMNNNIVKLSNGALHFNNAINTISIVLFIATFFIIFKMSLNKVDG